MEDHTEQTIYREIILFSVSNLFQVFGAANTDYVLNIEIIQAICSYPIMRLNQRANRLRHCSRYPIRI